MGFFKYDAFLTHNAEHNLSAFQMALIGEGLEVFYDDFSYARAVNWAATVKEWFDDPHHADRQMGWAEPASTPEYSRPLRRLVIRWTKNNGQRGYAMLVSTLEPRDVLLLLGQPLTNLCNPQLVASAYAEFYDQRGGGVETAFKQDKQGFGLTKRKKKRAAAQQMVVMLNSLAHNVLVWARDWLSAMVPKVARYGMLRLVRDVLSVSGKLELNKKTGAIKRIVLREIRVSKLKY